MSFKEQTAAFGDGQLLSVRVEVSCVLNGPTQVLCFGLPGCLLRPESTFEI